MELPADPGDREPRDVEEGGSGTSLTSALEREDLERELQLALRKEKWHLIWMTLGISPAAVIPALGLLREGSFGLLILLGVLVTASQWVSWTRTSRKAEAIEEKLAVLSTESESSRLGTSPTRLPLSVQSSGVSQLDLPTSEPRWERRKPGAPLKGGRSGILKGRNWIRVPGRVVHGHGVAGGSSRASPYRVGTISLQAPLFAERGLDLSGFHLATLNVSTSPFVVQIEDPAFHFQDVSWTDVHGPESFDFIHVFLVLGGRRIPAWGYRPTPETKAGHPQPDTVLEVIAPFLPEIKANPDVLLELDPGEVVVFHPESQMNDL